MTLVDAITKRGVDLSLPPAPADRAHGVYLLISAGQVIYVGATSNIDLRLADHYHGTRRTPPKAFDRAVWLRLQRADLLAYEGALIRAFRPPLNTRSPAPCGRDLEILGQLGLPPHDEAAVYAEFRAARYSPRPRPAPRAKRKARS